MLLTFPVFGHAHLCDALTFTQVRAVLGGPHPEPLPGAQRTQTKTVSLQEELLRKGELLIHIAVDSIRHYLFEGYMRFCTLHFPAP